MSDIVWGFFLKSHKRQDKDAAWMKLRSQADAFTGVAFST